MAFTPWVQIVYDKGDAVLESDWYAERLALPVTDPARVVAEQSVAYVNTPINQHMDALGRPIRVLRGVTMSS